MIYLDNCATTEMRSEVLNKMIESLEKDFANPSSLHNEGFLVEKKIEVARKEVADLLDVKKEEIYFTSGGTESNNLAISMALEKMKNRGKHIITTSVEHASVSNYMKKLEDDGYRVSYLEIDESGNFKGEEFKELLSEETILVSIMQVNNEIGSIMNLELIKDIIEKSNLNPIFHVDGVQGYGKLKINLRDLGVDLYSFSSHKIYGPKGVGGLFISGSESFEAVLYGGNQERGIRSGTENVAGIIAFGEASRIMKENYRYELKHVQEIKDYAISKLKENIDDISINCESYESSPYILSVSIRNIRAEVLLHYLAEEKIYISTSSACSSNDTKKSHVLKAIGLDDNDIEGTIRICFSYKTSKGDIDFLVEKMKKYIEEIRNIMMR